MAFRSNRVWGVQFHPEVDPPILQRMARGLGAPDEVVTEMVDGARRWDAEHRLAARRLFEAFWADAGPAQVRA
jgi:GMP synthase-like glutamine amidotransferase